MPKITYNTHDKKTHTIDVQKGLTVMEGAVQNDIPGIDADCGGGMACATCHVYVNEEWLDKLHHHVKDQLPKPNNGLIDAYREIIPALIKQKKDKSYFIKKDIPQLQNV